MPTPNLKPFDALSPAQKQVIQTCVKNGRVQLWPHNYRSVDRLHETGWLERRGIGYNHYYVLTETAKERLHESDLKP